MNTRPHATCRRSLLPRPTFHSLLRRSRQGRRLAHLLPALTLALLLQGCAKDSMVISPGPIPIPTPIPIHPINFYPIQEPLQAFVTKYNIPITSTSESIGLTTGYFDTYTRSGAVEYNAAELGFAFRSSVSGTILGLGTLLPATGFAHTVTLWDSATQTVLATASVTGQSGSVFTYTDFATSVAIRADHGYVVGYNTLANGNPLNSYSTGNAFYVVTGILVDGGQGSDIPLTPFTTGTITVENTFENNYGDGQPPTNLFPTASDWIGQNVGFFGLCDIAFVQ
jgi:hypothetical protein